MDNNRTRPIEIDPVQTPLDFLIDRQAFNKTTGDRNKLPSAENFYVIPERNTLLRSYIQSVNWNSTVKQLTVWIVETASFAAYKWFSNLDKDALALVFLDEDDKEVNRLRFTSLSLVEHNCGMCSNNEFGVADKKTPLKHCVVLDYEDVQFCDLKDPSLDTPDGEWYKEELESKIKKDPVEAVE